MEYLVQMKNISKYFDGIVALENVNFEVGYTDAIGLVGDNGAGKSTLIKILSGVFPPDKGEIFIKGKKIENYSVQKARKLGIETVYQEKALAEQQTLWRNIFMGRRKITNKLGFLKIKKAEEETRKLIKELGFTSKITPNSIVKKLSGGEKEGVAIARALYFEADLIILDEPTMALSLSETKKVLNFIREVKRKGKSCIFITHNIYHVYPVADRFVILDRGKRVGDFKKKDISLETLMDKLILVTKMGKVK